MVSVLCSDRQRLLEIVALQNKWGEYITILPTKTNLIYMNKIKQVLLKGLLSLHGQKKICDCLQEIDSAFDILLREHQKVWQENLNAESNIGLELYRRKLKKQKEEIKKITLEFLKNNVDSMAIIKYFIKY